MLRKLVLALLIPAAVAGCAVTRQTSVVVGTVRPSLAPEQVKLYTKPPTKYEEIAVVSADAAHDFMDKQALLDTAILNAKKEAAKVGANGLLLESLGRFAVGTSGVGTVQSFKGLSVGTMSSNIRSGEQVSGRAIFVTEE